MNFLGLILGCSVVLNIYLSYKLYKKNNKVKACIYCAEKIKEKAKICRWCGKSQTIDSVEAEEPEKDKESSLIDGLITAIFFLL